MKVYDGFLFFKELDLLELRLEIMNPFVDFFVITESTTTFSGKQKELHFKNNSERFKKFHNKIIYNVVYDTPDVGIWDRERFQRNSIIRGFAECHDYDLVITGDVDEIPNMSCIFSLDNIDVDTLYHPLQRFYYYYLNVLKEEGWFGTKICSYAYLKTFSVDEIRNQRNGIILPNCGWHFSFLGGADLIIDKLNAYGHQEFNNENIKNNLNSNIQANKDIFFRQGVQLVTVPIDESYPEYIQSNQQSLKERGFIK